MYLEKAEEGGGYGAESCRVIGAEHEDAEDGEEVHDEKEQHEDIVDALEPVDQPGEDAAELGNPLDESEEAKEPQQPQDGQPLGPAPDEQHRKAADHDDEVHAVVRAVFRVREIPPLSAMGGRGG